MKAQDYNILDWHRILIGDVPDVFFIEVVIRTIVIYFILISSIRLMGKRMALQLNVTEMTAMVALAAAIGTPLQAPDRGLVPAVVIAIVVVGAERYLSLLASKNQKLEHILDGDINLLVEDSVLNFECMKLVNVSRDLLFEQIRANGCDHLGQVKRFYLESSGAFSIIKETDHKPGLSVIPLHDADYWEASQKTDVSVCKNCGRICNENIQQFLACQTCGKSEWQQAVL